MYDQKKRTADEVLLEVQGDLTFGRDFEFQKQLHSLLALDTKNIVLNLAKVDHIDSSSIGSMLKAREKLSAGGRKMLIKGCSNRLLEVFKTVKLDGLINIEE